MSETLYMRISTQNIACSQRQMNTCHTSFSYILRERERERERERDRQTDRQTQTDTDRQTDRQTATSGVTNQHAAMQVFILFYFFKLEYEMYDRGLI